MDCRSVGCQIYYDDGRDEKLFVFFRLMRMREKRKRKKERFGFPFKSRFRSVTVSTLLFLSWPYLVPLILSFIIPSLSWLESLFPSTVVWSITKSIPLPNLSLLIFPFKVGFLISLKSYSFLSICQPERCSISIFVIFHFFL